MGYTHFDGVSSKTQGFATGKAGAEVQAISPTGQLYQSGTAITSTAAELNKLSGATPTTAQINLLTQGVAAGYKIARGVAAVGAASVDVVTGLATVVAVIPGMVGDPSLTHMFSSATVGDQAGAPAAGSIRIKSWKPTGAADVTPVAATSPFGNVAWIAIGT